MAPLRSNFNRALAIVTVGLIAAFSPLMTEALAQRAQVGGASHVGAPSGGSFGGPAGPSKPKPAVPGDADSVGYFQMRVGQ